MSTQGYKGDNDAGIGREMSGLKSSSTVSKFLQNLKFPSTSEWNYIGSKTPSPMNSPKNSPINQEGNPENFRQDTETVSIHSFDSLAFAQDEQVIFFPFVVSVIFVILQHSSGFHMMFSYAASHARNGAAAAGVAEYYCHVQAGLWRVGLCPKQGESSLI